jgi:hypothetical protein
MMYWLKVEDGHVVAAVPEGEDGIPKFVSPAKITETGGTWHRMEASSLSEAVSKVTVHLMGAHVLEDAETNPTALNYSSGGVTLESGSAPWPVSINCASDDDVAPRNFSVVCAHRQVMFTGNTLEEAVGHALKGYAELGWNGSINPYNPSAVGSPIIQHVLEILQHALSDQVAQRYQDWAEGAPGREVVELAEQEGTTAGAVWSKSPTFTRRNEIVSGIATAIAALARVKEL